MCSNIYKNSLDDNGNFAIQSFAFFSVTSNDMSGSIKQKTGWKNTKRLIRT